MSGYWLSRYCLSLGPKVYEWDRPWAIWSLRDGLVSEVRYEPGSSERNWSARGSWNSNGPWIGFVRKNDEGLYTLPHIFCVRMARRWHHLEMSRPPLFPGVSSQFSSASTCAASARRAVMWTCRRYPGSPKTVPETVTCKGGFPKMVFRLFLEWSWTPRDIATCYTIARRNVTFLRDAVPRIQPLPSDLVVSRNGLASFQTAVPSERHIVIRHRHHGPQRSVALIVMGPLVVSTITTDAFLGSYGGRPAWGTYDVDVRGCQRNPFTNNFHQLPLPWLDSYTAATVVLRLTETCNV